MNSPRSRPCHSLKHPIPRANPSGQQLPLIFMGPEHIGQCFVSQQHNSRRALLRCSLLAAQVCPGFTGISGGLCRCHFPFGSQLPKGVWHTQNLLDRQIWGLGLCAHKDFLTFIIQTFILNCPSKHTNIFNRSTSLPNE